MGSNLSRTAVKRDSSALVLEKYPDQQSKRARPSSNFRHKINLWTLDAHLNHLSVWLEYLNTYKCVGDAFSNLNFTDDDVHLFRLGITCGLLVRLIQQP